MSSVGIPVINPVFPTGSGRSVALTVAGTSGAYVCSLAVTDPSTGMQTEIIHLLDCADVDTVEREIQSYCAFSL